MTFFSRTFLIARHLNSSKTTRTFTTMTTEKATFAAGCFWYVKKGEREQLKFFVLNKFFLIGVLNISISSILNKMVSRPK